MSNNKIKSGFLITLEGIDGAGKSSVAKAIRDFFISKNQEVVLTREPGATKLGSFLRKILHERDFEICDKSEFLLFASDRAQHMASLVKPALDVGKIVISDRMADSSLAYQGYARGLDKEKIKFINSWAMDQMVPDVTIYLKIDHKTAMSRLSSRESYTSFEKEKAMFFDKVIYGFEEIFNQRNNVIFIDASLDFSSVVKSAIEQTWKFYNNWLNDK